MLCCSCTQGVGSFFDILGETLLGFTRVIMGSKTTIWVLYFCLKNSANYWVKHRIFLPKKKMGKNERDHFFLAHRIYLYYFLSPLVTQTTTKGILD